MKIDWQIKEDAEPVGKGEFWYDLVWGGYLDPADVLDDPDQMAKLQEAITIVASFENMLINNDLMVEM